VPIADGLPAGLVLADSALWRQLRVSPARGRCEGLGCAVGLHRTDHGVRSWMPDVIRYVAVGDLRRIGRGGFRRVTWREGTEGEDVVALSPPNVWCSRRTRPR